MWSGIKEYAFVIYLIKIHIKCDVRHLNDVHHHIQLDYVRHFTLQVSDEDNEGLKPIVKLLSRDENKVRLKPEYRWIDSW